MSSPDAWPCLTVEAFFSRCNWQGQAQIGASQQNLLDLKQTETTVGSNPDPWPCLTVEAFFSHCNWQGQARSSRSTGFQDQLLDFQQIETATTNPPEFWLCLTVEAFFSHYNWQGQAQISPSQQQVDSPSPLTLLVGEFFPLVPWESKPTIGALPKRSPTAQLIPDRVENTLSKLSELF